MSSNPQISSVQLLAKALGGDTDRAQSLYTTKLKHRTFSLQNPATSAAIIEERKLKRERHLPFAKRQQRQQLTSIDQLQFCDAQRINDMWRAYMRTVLGELKGEAVLVSLLKADWHGAFLIVLQSKCPSYVGIAGIVVQETMHTFKIVTSSNELKCLPKANMIFRLAINDAQSFKLYGSQLVGRSAERTSKKWKDRPTLDF